MRVLAFILMLLGLRTSAQPVDVCTVFPFLPQCAGTNAWKTLAVDYEWGFTGDLSTICTGDSECVGLCGVGVRTGGSSWECIDHSGAALGTVVDPGTGAVIDSFIQKADGGFVKALDITAASQAPNLVSTAIDAVYGGGTDGGGVAMTTVMVGYGRTTGALNHNNWFMDGYPGGSVGYMQIIYDDSAAGPDGAAGFFCSTSNGGAAGAGNIPRDSWSIVSCRHPGTGGSTANKKVDVGLNQSPSASGLRRDMQAGTHYIFGASNARTDMVNGPLALWVAFNTNKSDAFLRNLQGKIWRDYNAAGVVTPHFSATVRPDYLDHVSSTGNADVLLTLAPMVESKGLRTTRGHQNTWAADALDVSTWTKISTPTINTNVSSGPFSVVKHAAECDEIVAADGGVGMGVKGLESWDAGTPSKNFNNNCYLKAGLTGTQTTSARLSWATNGTSSVDHCDITGLTSTATRNECTSLFSGAVSTVKPTLFIPNDAGVVGSVQVCGCFNTEGPALEPPRPDNTVVPDFFYTLSPSTDAWPDFHAVKVKVEIVHTPLFDPAAVSVQPVNGDPDYLLDIDNSTDTLPDAGTNADHSTGLVFGYTGDGYVLAIFRFDGVVNDILTPGITLVKDHTYASAVAWTPTSGGKCKLYVYHNDCGSTPATRCHATKLVAKDISGTASCPATPTGAHLGNRFTETVGTSTRINALRIYK